MKGKNMSSAIFDVLVIGEGVSGLAAAGALARHGLRTATLEAQLFGGLVINVNELEPGPAGRQVSGAEFASELMQANADLGVISIQEPATAISAAGELKRVATASADYRAHQVVIASGARLKKLGVPGETEFEGRGVSQCADCDGPMYQNEDVVVVGGGDSALQEALVLARYCRKVHLVHRGTSFRAQRYFLDRVQANDRIVPLWNATVEAISGGKMVEKVSIRRADAGVESLPCAGVFAYIGLAPNTDFLPAEIVRDEAGFVITSDARETAVPGIWAAGAVRSGCGGSLDDAIADAYATADGVRVRAAQRNK
jgi:thioredoxin reductase (NADPH)